MRSLALELDGKIRCLTHATDPARIRRRQERDAKGGLARTQGWPADVPLPKIPRTLEALPRWCARVAEQVLRGKVDPRLVAEARNLAQLAVIAPAWDRGAGAHRRVAVEARAWRGCRAPAGPAHRWLGRPEPAASAARAQGARVDRGGARVVTIARAERYLLERLGTSPTVLLAVLLELSTPRSWGDGVDAKGRTVVLVERHALGESKAAREGVATVLGTRRGGRAPPAPVASCRRPVARPRAPGPQRRRQSPQWRRTRAGRSRPRARPRARCPRPAPRTLARVRCSRSAGTAGIRRVA